MKKIIYIVLILSTIAISCSKKGDKLPEAANTVTIQGKAYSTVVIGNQTWTTENYDGPGGTPSSRGDEGTIGKFYLLDEVQKLSLPTGWRVPTEADFINLLKLQGDVTENYDGSLSLIDTLGVHHLRSKSGWGIPGDNKSGFNALPAGKYNAYENIFPDLNAYAYFWSSTPGTNTVAPPSQCYLILGGYYTSPGSGKLPIDFAVVTPADGVLNSGYSLRFVKDN